MDEADWQARLYAWGKSGRIFSGRGWVHSHPQCPQTLVFLRIQNPKESENKLT